MHSFNHHIEQWTKYHLQHEVEPDDHEHHYQVRQIDDHEDRRCHNEDSSLHVQYRYSLHEKHVEATLIVVVNRLLSLISELQAIIVVHVLDVSLVLQN